MQKDNITAETKESSDQEVSDSQDLFFRVTTTSIIYRYMFLLLLTIVGIFIFIMLIPATVAGKDYLTSGLLIFWALALAKYWTFILSMPYQIYLTDDDALRLRSIFQRKELPCEEIVLIKVSPLQQAYLKIITSRKKTFLLFNHINGLHEMINQIKKINPDLETIGC